MLPLKNFLSLVLLAALCIHGNRIFEGTASSPHLAFAAAGDGSSAADSLPQHAIPASISRRLAFPDFRDDEKAGAITLLGSAEIDKRSGTINIPSTVRPGSAAGSSAMQEAYSTAATQPPADWSNTAGRALYSFPFRMMDPVSGTMASFHTSFSFRIRNGSDTGSGRGSGTKEGATNTSDSGLTFLIVPDELTVGRNGGWLGMMNDACDDSYKPFAVEFDTFKNEEFQDPNDHHVGINYGSIVSRRTADISDAGVYLRDGTPARAWISYDSSQHLVDVRLAKDGSEKPLQPLLSLPLDLSDIFKEYMFVGFSGGASGESGHSILSWHFSSDCTGLLRFPKEESCADLLLPIRKQSRKAPSAFIIFCLVILIVVLAVINFACIPYKTKEDEAPTAVKLMRLAREKPRPIHKARKISLCEILEASRFFNEGEILGYGGRGTIYRGVLRSSAQVAIKRFSSSYLEQTFGLSTVKRKMEKKISRLAHLHHPNLVPLRGWCLEKGEILLVYDYMPNGSLDQWLFSQASIFPWIRRYKIVKELAGALSFMHSNPEKPIVHKNVKLSNVLLDIAFRAKLGDYGLFKRHRSSRAMSSIDQSASNSRKLDLTTPPLRRPMSKGCMPAISWSFCATKDRAKMIDPSSRSTDFEVRTEGPLISQETSSQMKGCMPRAVAETIKEKANEVSEDVYCYGVMLFEIVCGRISEGEDSDEEDKSLVDWVWSLQEEGRLAEAIDEDLRAAASRYYTWEEEAECVLSVGLLCTLQEPSLRPSMSLVAKYLQGEALLPKVPPRYSLKRKDPLVLQPDISPDDERSRYAPPSKAFDVWSPLELRCLGSASSHE